jgi:hypothetical protein
VLFQSNKPILKQQNPDCFREGFWLLILTFPFYFRDKIK